MVETLIAVLSKNALITAFAVVGIIIWLSYWLSDRISAGRIHGSAIAITVGLVLAYFGGGCKPGAVRVSPTSSG